MKILICFLFLLFSRVGFAETTTIGEIKIIGLTKTSRTNFLNILAIGEGDTATREDIDLAVQRIKNIRLFNGVEYSVRQVENKLFLTVEAEDRWTTIPIAKFSSGGGISQTVLGLYDSNIAGSLYEAGLQFERLGGTNSFVSWLKKHRIGALPLTLDFQLWSTNILRTLYDQESSNLFISGGYLEQRENLNALALWEFNNDLRIRVGFEIGRRKFNDDILPEMLSDTLKEEQIIPSNLSSQLVSFNLGLGSLSFGDFLAEGTSLDFDIRLGRFNTSEDATDKIYSEQSVRLITSKILTPRFTIAARAEFVQNNGLHPSFDYFLGGLDKIRGYSDGRFRSSRYALLNSEFRGILASFGGTVLQSVAFYDLLSLGRGKHGFAKADGASIGVGGRIIIPRIYRFILRLDYAKSLIAEDPQTISFGVQQFF